MSFLARPCLTRTARKGEVSRAPRKRVDESRSRHGDVRERRERCRAHERAATGADGGRGPQANAMKQVVHRVVEIGDGEGGPEAEVRLGPAPELRDPSRRPRPRGSARLRAARAPCELSSPVHTTASATSPMSPRSVAVSNNSRKWAAAATADRLGRDREHEPVEQLEAGADDAARARTDRRADRTRRRRTPPAARAAPARRRRCTRADAGRRRTGAPSSRASASRASRPIVGSVRAGEVFEDRAAGRRAGS